MKSSSSLYFSRLDHLRFLAAMMVLFWHALHHGNKVPTSVVPRFFLASLFEEGHAGVALFLTLSGFLFAALTDGKQIDYSSFIRNRLLRIAPLFLVWTFVGFYTSEVTAERLLSTVLTLLDRFSYPGAGWTVLVEFQLYLVFPFLLRFTRQYGLRYLAGVVGVTLLVRAGNYYVAGTAHNLAYWTVFGRADQFIGGMLWYFAYRRFQRVLGHPIVFPLALVGLSFAYHKFNVRGGFYGYDGDTFHAPIWIVMPTLEGFGHGLLIATYLAWRVPVPRFIDKPLAWLGSLSFSLYLNHLMVTGACFGWAGRPGSPLGRFPLETLNDFTRFTAIVILPVLVLVSALTYYVIEHPFLKLRRPYAQALAPQDSGSSSANA